MRRTKDDAELTRRKLLQASYELILDKGYERMTQDDIAKRVSMTRGAVNWHFESKEAIYIAILTDFLDHLAERRQAIYQQSTMPVEERLTALFVMPVQEWDKFSFINQISPYLLKLPSFQAIHRRMENNRKEFRAYLEACLAELETARGKPLTHDKNDVTALLFFLYEGLHSPSAESLFGDSLNEQSVAQYLRLVLTQLG
ncbi:TetR/AcrR family transcriptional regulator [Desulfovibrio sp. OttesenSCG-928-I05]|nr:TetR/AcrR family transcriptional regulator [Desulfovibrio sp. OttesenSCG-928-I05]